MPEETEQKKQDEGTGSGDSGAQKNLERPTAEEIFQQVARNADAELKRTSFSLAVSGVAGGLFMGLSALGVALVISLLGVSSRTYVISRMFYPLGFMVVILGRAQLFTENTLYPVALVLAERRQLWNTLRLWCIVLPTNVLGALTFAALVSLTPAVKGEVVHSIAQLGLEALAMHGSAIFWSGVMAGWIIATTAWLVSGSHSISGSAILIWIMTFVVGLGGFAHCIATSSEILTAVLAHQASWLAYLHWLMLAVAGNVCGGIFMVTMLEYGQAVAGETLQQEAHLAGTGKGR